MVVLSCIEVVVGVLTIASDIGIDLCRYRNYLSELLIKFCQRSAVGV